MSMAMSMHVVGVGNPLKLLLTLGLRRLWAGCLPAAMVFPWFCQLDSMSHPPERLVLVSGSELTFLLHNTLGFALWLLSPQVRVSWYDSTSRPPGSPGRAQSPESLLGKASRPLGGGVPLTLEVSRSSAALVVTQRDAPSHSDVCSVFRMLEGHGVRVGLLPQQK